MRQLHHLPSAPRVLPRLKKLLSDGNSAIQDVVAMIRLDPGIAARVLQMGNSAYYGRGLRCYTVDEAVNRGGFDQGYELVATAVASQVLVRPLAAYGVEADELWKMSVACGLAAETVAENAALDRDIAYTIGLLHTVGLVAIDEWAFRHHPELRFSPGKFPLETCEIERASLGFHNGEAGAALLRLWEFPSVMTEPLRWQYLPKGTASHHQFACVLHVAKWLRTVVCHGLDNLARPDATILRGAGLTPGRLDQLVETVSTQLESVSSLLENDVPERTAFAFPGGRREFDDHRITRTFIDRYV